MPTEDEIESAVTRLLYHRSRGALGMQAEHLKRWLESARNADKSATTTARSEMTKNRGDTAVQPATNPKEADNWEMTVDLIQFWEGKLV